MQHTKEGGLKATCVAIVPEKTFWYLIDFVWNGGEWRYKFVTECPGDVFCNDINRERKCLRQVVTQQAETTLAGDLAPDGSTRQQAKKMKETAIKWLDAMHSGQISRSEAWLAITSTIWKTLTYPLLAIKLSKEQCKEIMEPILTYGLPAIGVCRNFPRSMVFAPTKYMDLGLQYLSTIQEIEHLKTSFSILSIALLWENYTAHPLSFYTLNLGSHRNFILSLSQQCLRSPLIHW